MQQQITNTERNEQTYKSIRLTEETAKRLQKRAIKYGDSYETIVSRLLNYVEGRETPEDNRSF